MTMVHLMAGQPAATKWRHGRWTRRPSTPSLGKKRKSGSTDELSQQQEPTRQRTRSNVILHHASLREATVPPADRCRAVTNSGATSWTNYNADVRQRLQGGFRPSGSGASSCSGQGAQRAPSCGAPSSLGGTRPRRSGSIDGCSAGSAFIDLTSYDNVSGGQWSGGGLVRTSGAALSSAWASEATDVFSAAGLSGGGGDDSDDDDDDDYNGSSSGAGVFDDDDDEDDDSAAESVPPRRRRPAGALSGGGGGGLAAADRRSRGRHAVDEWGWFIDAEDEDVTLVAASLQLSRLCLGSGLVGAADDCGGIGKGGNASVNRGAPESAATVATSPATSGGRSPTAVGLPGLSDGGGLLEDDSDFADVDSDCGFGMSFLAPAPAGTTILAGAPAQPCPRPVSGGGGQW